MIVAIDFGSTNCRIAVPGERFEPGFVTLPWCRGASLILDDSGKRSTPSLASRDAEAGVWVGHAAARARGWPPAKSFLGGDESETCDPYALPANMVAVHVLTRVKELAEERLGEAVHRAVLTAPAGGDIDAAGAVQRAANLAGFDHVAIVPDPVAAVVAFCATDERKSLRILTYDWGGAKFETALVEKTGNAISVVRVSGDRLLGGYSLDRILASWLADRFLSQGYQLDTDFSTSTTSSSAAVLTAAAENVKVALSAETSHFLGAIPGLTDRNGDAVYLNEAITREQFEELIRPAVERTVGIAAQLTSIPESDRDIDEVILTGGVARIPMVARRMAEVFHRAPRVLEPECVALGAALIAAQLQAEQLVRQGNDIVADAIGRINRIIGIDRINRMGGDERVDAQRLIIQLGDGVAQLERAATIAVQAGHDAREIEAVLDHARAQRDAIQRYLANHAAAQAVQRANAAIEALSIDAERESLDRLASELRKAEAELAEAAALDPTNEDVARNLRTCREIEHELNLRQRTKPAGPQRLPEVPGGRVDRVHFSVSAPPAAPPEAVFIVNVWAHLESDREAVVARARDAAAGAPVIVQTKGPTHVVRGTVLSVRLWLEGLIVDRREDTILWEGEVGNATFPVRVPKEPQHGPRQGVVAIYANGLRVARIDFVIHVGAQLLDARALSVHEKRHRTAFACYAARDRQEVAARIQGIRKGAPGIDIFWDRHSLSSGQQWEAVIRREIPARDVFYLFWSRAASRSQWVDKEWRCALETKGIDYIDPVPLAPPEEVPPPPELAGALHFNDWELAYTRCASQPRQDSWWSWLRRRRKDA